jgi:1,4-dihydroxy-2-naphthoate octaprenyltransferase
VTLDRKFLLGFWHLADPKISLASFSGLFLAACVAAAHGPLDWFWLAMTVLGVFCVEVAKNASGEVVDYDSGTDLAIGESDRSPFSGGKRVMVDGLLTRNQTWAIAAVFYLAAIAVGMAIVLRVEPRVLAFGVAGIALAWYYHAGSIRLSYRGLGELAVAIAYGPLVVCGAYLVQRGHLFAPLVHASMSLGLLVAAFLWINEFPDYRADREAGKGTLVVRLGPERAATGYVTLVTAGYLWLLLTVLYYPQARGLGWGLLGALPTAFSAWRLASSEGITHKIIPAQTACLLGFLSMAAGSGLGYLLS